MSPALIIILTVLIFSIASGFLFVSSFLMKKISETLPNGISGIINIGQSNNNVNIHEDENNHFEFSENGDNGFEYSTGKVIITLPGIEASISGNVLLPNSGSYITTNSELSLTGEISFSGGSYRMDRDNSKPLIHINEFNEVVLTESKSYLLLDISERIYENHQSGEVTVTGILNYDGSDFILSDFEIDCDCCITYKVVEPTEAEFDEILTRLQPILSLGMPPKDNVYNTIFRNSIHNNWYFGMNFPNYETEFKEYFGFEYHGKKVPGNDPLGHFGTMPPSEWFDEYGYYFGHEAEYEQFMAEHPEVGVTCGYIEFNAVAMDWLIEGVLNCEVRHEDFKTFYEITDEPYAINIYYHNGAYYDEFYAQSGGIGIGPMPYVDSIDSIESIGDGKYRITYTIV